MQKYYLCIMHHIKIYIFKNTDIVSVFFYQNGAHGRT